MKRKVIKALIRRGRKLQKKDSKKKAFKKKEHDKAVDTLFWSKDGKRWPPDKKLHGVKWGQTYTPRKFK